MNERTGPVRAPAVAGAFYPDDAVDLTHLVENCFSGRRGPGSLPVRHRSDERHIRAAIVPHAGYIYSGPIAAHAYHALAAERPPSTIVVLGVNHRARGAPAALSAREWSTPLGTVPVDRELVHALAKGPIVIDEAAHATEHSIEVQLPFLQYVFPKPRIVALSVSFGTLAFLTDVAAVVRRATHGRDVLFLSSTDFSHYLPASDAQRLDRHAIDEILARRGEGLYRTVLAEDISMCGIAPTTVLLELLADEPLEARLLRWGHSGETETMRDVVGYASLLLESVASLGATGP